MGRKVVRLRRQRARKTVAVLGLTFKPNTDDIATRRRSPSSPPCRRRRRVRAYDPKHGEARAGLTTSSTRPILTPARRRRCARHRTEWDAFRALDLPRLKLIMAAPVVVDLRKVYRPGT